MAGEALAGVDRSTGVMRAYAPSWLDMAANALVALPGPALAAFAGLAAFAVGVANLDAWLGGQEPAGTLTFDWSSNAFWMVYPVALYAYLGDTAARAWADFRPAAGVADDQATIIRYELTTTPRRPALLLAAVGVALPLIGYATDPVGQRVAGIGPAALGLRACVECLSVSVILVLVFQMIRQLRLVVRLHDGAVGINLLRPGPAYAFSRLTVRAGAGVLVVAAWQVLGLSFQPLTPAYLGLMGVIIAIGIAAFLLPLTGMQRRLAAEKARLEDGVSERLETTMARVHDSVDGGDLAAAEQLNRTLATLVQERELIGRLRTWPWSPGTLSVFMSAIALPIAIWLVTRLLERIV